MAPTERNPDLKNPDLKMTDFAEMAQVEVDFVGRAAGLRELLDGGDQGRTDVDGEELLGLDGGQNIAGFGCLWHER